MGTEAVGKSSRNKDIWRLSVLALLLSNLYPYDANALSIDVVDRNGVAVTDYRWLVEEDATKASIPGLPADASNLSLNFHTSYMPVVAAGRVAMGTVTKGPDPATLALDPNKRYFVSILPDGGGHQMGGAPLAKGQSAVSVVVNPVTTPTAQISIFVFKDDHPISGTPSLPQEAGLAGFSIILKEAGGTYGQSGGQVTQDAFGNPIGTSYRTCTQPNVTNNKGGCTVVGEVWLNPDGTPVVDVLGNGFVLSGADGTALIKYLSPAKYTVEVSPPEGQGWVQTSTIEGTKGIDAWVKANEPSYFQEFGPAGHHVDIGFVKPFSDASVLTGGKTITGKVVNQHMSRPPNFTFYNGDPVKNCWVGLNELVAVGGRAIFAAPCNADSTFAIPNVPAGTYQLVIWDEPLDRIFASTNVVVPAGGGTLDLTDVPVFNWFARYEASVFYDADADGFRDPGEAGIPDQALNLRFRDGSIYQATATDPQGKAQFNEVFPFFNWLVAEVDYARFKATGATIAVDNGGPIPADAGWTTPSLGKLNPQPQNCTQADLAAAVPGCVNVGDPLNNIHTGNNLSKTETGVVLLEGMQTFLGQTNYIEWGKVNYGPGESGGISGIVQYATVRAEEDPSFAAAENWEPGIPRVQVNLYKDCNKDGIPDMPNCSPTARLNATMADVQFADVDNYPFCWSDAEFVAANPTLCPGGAVMGPEDVNRTGRNIYNRGHAFDIAHTDSWDDNLPTGCQGAPFVSNGVTTDCYDGLRNFNQVRPAVFDGGYAFGGGAGAADLKPGAYIVEAVAPPGYETVKEEDKNVDFGAAYVPAPLLLPPVCVGDDHVVPNELTLMPGVVSAYAGQTRKLCDRKTIDVAQGKNAGVNFFMFTEVPASAHLTGFILDDTANEFDPNAPTFGEKHAPPHLPVSIRDWTGREIQRIYSDQWGTYNALVPSSYSMNIPMPSGVSPNMVTTCMNDPGPIPDPAHPGQTMIDPYFNRQYSQFCYTFQYLPGKTTYLDTPVLPVAAFAGPGQFPLDCEYQDGTPVIYSANGGVAGKNGPYVASGGGQLSIVSLGPVSVSNPAYSGPGGTAPQFITRNYGFGANQGTVRLNGVNLPIQTWNDGVIVATVPGDAGTGQLEVTTADGKTTVTGVTVTVGGPDTAVRTVMPGQTIQSVVDAAASGDLILVPPGNYDEMVIMNKKVRLQGWGAPSTIIRAMKAPGEKLQLWRNKLNQMLAAKTFNLLPGQTAGFNGANNEPNMFTTEEAPGVMVVAKRVGTEMFDNNRNAWIDGFTITGADQGGGIFVNGYADYLAIGNNRIINNYGIYGGGIRVGHPRLTNPNFAFATDDTINGGYTDASNDHVRIHHNQVLQNGGSGEAGGGVAMYTGSHNYQVTDNFVCGNFTGGNGGGIGHLGRSMNGLIAHNTVVFNQTFNQGAGVSGGGIYVAGQASLAPATTPTLSPGSGHVTVSSNLILGNNAGAGDGGGIRTEFVNGLDVQRTPNDPTPWYRLRLENNIVANNVAGLAGGGISLQDTVKAAIVANTIANNDSTGTAGAAFAPGSPNRSTPQPAGIVSRAHSTLLYGTIGSGAALPYKTEFSNPTLVNDIVWHNRSFYWEINGNATPPTFGLRANVDPYWDLAVLGTSSVTDALSPRYSLLGATVGGDGNLSGDPMFVSPYFNGNPGQTIQQPELTTSIATAPAFDEGGNFVDVRFGPLTLGRCTPQGTACTTRGDYHIQAGSPAINAGGRVQNPSVDIDGQGRNGRPDIGADELN